MKMLYFMVFAIITVLMLLFVQQLPSFLGSGIEYQLILIAVASFIIITSVHFISNNYG